MKADLGVERVEPGEFNEFEKVKALSKEHEIVVNAGSSFTPEPVDAIIAGLKERAASGLGKGKLVHVSGMCLRVCCRKRNWRTLTLIVRAGGGNFIDFGTSGSFNPDSKVWSDGNEEDIKLVNEKMFSGASDTL